METTAAELIHLVETSRAVTRDVFPLPNFEDCIDYAICEAAEYLDARLRIRRTEDKRNHRRAADPRAEWGQCGYMIASALMQCEYTLVEPFGWNGDAYVVIERLAVARINQDADYVYLAFLSWIDECRAYRWDSRRLLASTCAQFEKKHGLVV